FTSMMRMFPALNSFFSEFFTTDPYTFYCGSILAKNASLAPGMNRTKRPSGLYLKSGSVVPLVAYRKQLLSNKARPCFFLYSFCETHRVLVPSSICTRQTGAAAFAGNCLVTGCATSLW